MPSTRRDEKPINLHTLTAMAHVRHGPNEMGVSHLCLASLTIRQVIVVLQTQET